MADFFESLRPKHKKLVFTDKVCRKCGEKFRSSRKDSLCIDCWLPTTQAQRDAYDIVDTRRQEGSNDK